MTEMLRAALWYARHGWRVFPVNSITKRPCIKDMLSAASTDERQVQTWWREFRSAGIAAVFGPGSGVLVIDVDQHVDRRTGELIDGEKTLIRMEKKYGRLPPLTVEQRSGGGGRQLFFSYPPDLDIRSTTGSDPTPRSRRAWGRGVDVKAARGTATLPPSKHASGDRYAWIRSPGRTPLAELPAQWCELFTYREPVKIEIPPPRVDDLGHLARACIDGVCKRVAAEKTGNRNSVLYWAAATLAEKARAGMLDWRDAEAGLAHAAASAGLLLNDIRATIASGYRRGSSS
jgi:hypothetical protein